MFYKLKILVAFFKFLTCLLISRPFRDNTAMYNVYIVSYVKATLFINLVSILSLVAAIIFSQLGK